MLFFFGTFFATPLRGVLVFLPSKLKRNCYETFAFVGSFTPALRVRCFRQLPDVGGLF